MCVYDLDFKLKRRKKDANDIICLASILATQKMATRRSCDKNIKHFFGNMEKNNFKKSSLKKLNKKLS